MRAVLAVLFVLAVSAAVTIAAVAGNDAAPETASPVPTPTPAPSRGTTPEPAAPSSVPPPSPTPSEDSPEGAFVIWARGDLPQAFADEVAALPPVTAVAHVRSTTLGLVGSRAADGTPVDVLDSGFVIPVGVAAVDPSAYAETLVDGAGRDALMALAPGHALLSETAARLRRIGVGGEVDLAGRRGLEVVGVVPDGAVGRAEIVIHETDADAVGLDDDGTVFLRHEAGPGAETEALADAIGALVPADVTARVVDVGAGEQRRRAPLVLSLAQVKDRFGEFAFRPRPGVREIDIDPAFRAERIVTVEVPILGSVTCHRDIIDDLRGALEQIRDAGLAGEIDPRRYAGCFYPRRISTAGDRLSHHAWGIALDINVDLSLPDLGPPPHPGVIAAFEANGFRWGGDFLHPDNHHFEWVGEVGPAPPVRGG